MSRAMADFAVATASGKDIASFSVVFYLRYFDEQKIEESCFRGSQCLRSI